MSSSAAEVIKRTSPKLLEASTTILDYLQHTKKSAPAAGAEKKKNVPASSSLFEKPETIHIVLCFNHAPKDRLEPLFVPTPHVTLRCAADDVPSAFLLSCQPQRKYKDLVASSPTMKDYVQKINDEKKYQKKFATYDLQRRLCNSFHMLLVDSRILPARVPKLFGRTAISSNRIPFPVTVHQGLAKLEADVLQSQKIATVVFRGQNTVNICIGCASSFSSGKEVMENVLAVLTHVLDAKEADGSSYIVARQWVDIESISLEDTSSQVRCMFYAHTFAEEKKWLLLNAPTTTTTTAATTAEDGTQRQKKQQQHYKGKKKMNATTPKKVDETKKTVVDAVVVSPPSAAVQTTSKASKRVRENSPATPGQQKAAPASATPQRPSSSNVSKQQVKKQEKNNKNTPSKK